MLGYVMVGTNDLEKSSAFYDVLLSEVGMKRTMEGPDFIAWGGEASGSTSFCIGRPFNEDKATVGNGVMMAFAVSDPAAVDKLYAKAIELGATDEGAPAPRPEFDEKFYVGYFRDLDGNKMNFFHFPTPQA